MTEKLINMVRSYYGLIIGACIFAVFAVYAFLLVKLIVAILQKQ